MVNTISTIVMAVAALMSAPAQKEIVKLPLAESGAIVIKVMPHKNVPVDGNYVVEGEQQETPQTADSRYNDRKAALDERFAHMFALKDALEHAQSEMSKKWEEYYALHDKYNRELKRIVAAWVTESYYDGDNGTMPAPQPRYGDENVARPMPHRFERNPQIGDVPQTLEEK